MEKTIMKYYRCVKCDLNFVLNEGDICDVCKKQEKQVEDEIPLNVCLNCGKIIYGEREKYCKKCFEELTKNGFDLDYYNFDM